jgi:hypothetical protein
MTYKTIQMPDRVCGGSFYLRHDKLTKSVSNVTILRIFMFYCVKELCDEQVDYL